VGGTTIIQSSIQTVTSVSVQTQTTKITTSATTQTQPPQATVTGGQIGGQTSPTSNPTQIQPAEPSTVTIVVSSTSYSTSGTASSAIVVVYTSTSVHAGAVSNTLSPNSGTSSSNKGKIIGGAVGGAAVLCLLALAGILVCLSMRKRRSNHPSGIPGESPAPLVYAEPKPTYPTPPIPNPYGPPPHSSPSPTGYYSHPHSPSELSGTSSPPMFNNQPVYQPPPMSQPQPYTPYGNQGFQAGRAELANNNLPPIHEMGNSYVPAPGSRY
jgi:hypothetical protein